MTPCLPDPRDLAAARRSLRQLAAQGSRHETRHDDARLCWRHWGRGPDLVLLHGGHGSWMHWARNIETLATRFSVWVPDMPGFGDSDVLPGHPHDADRQERLVKALDEGLLHLLGDAAFCLAGFSFGGLTAAQLASVSTRVRRLALLGTAGHGGARRPLWELRDWRRVEGRARWEVHAHNLRALMLHQASHVDAKALVVHACASHATRYRSKAFSRAANLLDALSRYRGELLLIWGEHDVTAVPDDMGPIVRASNPAWELRIVPDAGHWVQYEQSGPINTILTDWFQSSTSFMP
ncbi:alpha/beta fold hydrolase [Acidovorax radicis]|uniref:alpha/beta fold hydrolase n=1 Tax=Acidovorax radicis TaxID=758826 RepID=UPI001CF8F318|nr:alpha/beta fold hydrolase [Acidovorax radicis]UCU98595.1 alpha/beta fold hydrolase [Acidovorax radicis]